MHRPGPRGGPGFVFLALLLNACFAFGQADGRRTRIREALFIEDPPPLGAQTHGRFFPEPGVVAERVSYATQFGMRIPAIVYRPERQRGRAPALIVVNGHGGDKYSWYAFYSGVLYARAGAVVLTYDPAGEGERNVARRSGTRAHDEVEPPAELGRRLGGLMVGDLMQAVSYLESRPDVDPRRIAAMGYSMGSFVTALAGAADPRLRACVLIGGGNLDGPGGYWDRSKPTSQAIPYRALEILGDRPAAIYSLSPNTLIVNGVEDTVVGMPATLEPFFADLRRRMNALGPGGSFETRWFEGASHRPYFVTRPAVEWLERQIDFPNWTAEAIRKMPETHIGPWARAGGVTLDASYAEEHREGGTRALGSRVPALGRDVLSVVSAAEWESRKQTLIHEQWLTEARRRLQEPRIAVRGTYATPKPLWDKGAVLSDLGVNGVFVHSGSITTDLVDRARREGARVYAEFATLNGRGYVEKNPEAWPVDEKGEKVKPATWFLGACPTDPGFRAWRMRQLDELLDRHAIDGVWMDYLHWHAQFEDPNPVLPETCFNDRCLDQFEARSGVNLPEGSAAEQAQWILEHHERSWREWRVSVILDWASEIRDRVRRKRPGALLGNYQCPWSDDEFGGARRRILGLDLVGLAGIVDVLSPMVYHQRMGRSPEWVGEHVRWVSRQLGIRPDRGPKLWPIVQAHGDPVAIPAAEFEQVLRLGGSSAATGVMMFTARSVAEDAGKIEVMRRLYRGWTPAPSR